VCEKVVEVAKELTRVSTNRGEDGHHRKTGKLEMYPKSLEPRLGPPHAADSSILHAVTARHPQAVTGVPPRGINGLQRASSRFSETFRAQRSSGTQTKQLGPQADLRERLGRKNLLSAKIICKYKESVESPPPQQCLSLHCSRLASMLPGLKHAEALTEPLTSNADTD
jgi:hypothetical protein